MSDFEEEEFGKNLCPPALIRIGYETNYERL